MLGKPVFQLDMQQVGKGRTKHPERQSRGAAGYDLMAALDAPLIIKAGSIVLVPTDWAMAIHENYCGLIKPRSGLMTRGLVALAGVIDSDYRGEVRVALHNVTQDDFVITNGNRIAQMVFVLVAQPWVNIVEELEPTGRGSGGFGSTGHA